MYHKMSRWLLDTYTTYETLSKHISLNNRIILEDIPSSRNHLAETLEAMHENKVIEITYERFTEPGQFTLKVHPYCVRVMDRRWYMLAMYPKVKDLRIYGLDRIQSLTITGQTFKMKKGFDAETYFAKDFGLVHKDDVKQERIVLRATKPHYNYLRSLPLHQSQKEIHTCEEYVDFELYLRPTYDFCYELLRHADMVEVLEPQSLRVQMREYSARLAEIYK